jgi:hypothetical protein
VVNKYRQSPSDLSHGRQQKRASLHQERARYG